MTRNVVENSDRNQRQSLWSYIKFLEIDINLSTKFSQGYTMGIYWTPKKSEQCSVIWEFDKLLTLVTATAVDIEDKQKQA